MVSTFILGRFLFIASCSPPPIDYVHPNMMLVASTLKLQWEDLNHPLTLRLTMSLPQKSQFCIPFYFATRWRDRTPPQSTLEELEAQQDLDLHAEDLKPAKLCKLKRDLDLYNATGHIVTFDKVLRDWVTWNRYVHKIFNILTSLIDLTISLKPSLESPYLLLRVVFSESPTLFHRSALMPITLSVLWRTAKWKPIERQSEGKSVGYFVPDDINVNSEVSQFSVVFLNTQLSFY